MSCSWRWRQRIELESLAEREDQGTRLKIQAQNRWWRRDESDERSFAVARQGRVLNGVR
jgi:hypothetical protein